MRKYYFSKYYGIYARNTFVGRGEETEYRIYYRLMGKMTSPSANVLGLYRTSEDIKMEDFGQILQYVFAYGLKKTTYTKQLIEDFTSDE